MTEPTRPMSLEVIETESEMPPRRSAGIIRADVDAVLAGLSEYQTIQARIDEMLPGSLIHISGKPYRKRSYWRAIATAFNVELSLVSEERVKMADGDWGFACAYRATAPNGRSEVGDGGLHALREEWRDGDAPQRPQSRAHPREEPRDQRPRRVRRGVRR